MRKFEIIPISHSLKGNKIAKSGDVVDESQLTSPALDLIKAGYIKEIFDGSELEVEVTKEILDENPELKAEGLEIGEIVTVDAEEEKAPVVSKEEMLELKKKVKK